MRTIRVAAAKVTAYLATTHPPTTYDASVGAGRPAM